MAPFVGPALHPLGLLGWGGIPVAKTSRGRHCGALTLGRRTAAAPAPTPKPPGLQRRCAPRAREDGARVPQEPARAARAHGRLRPRRSASAPRQQAGCGPPRAGPLRESGARGTSLPSPSPCLAARREAARLQGSLPSGLQLLLNLAAAAARGGRGARAPAGPGHAPRPSGSPGWTPRRHRPAPQPPGISQGRPQRGAAAHGPAARSLGGVGWSGAGWSAGSPDTSVHPCAGQAGEERLRKSARRGAPSTAPK